jgi:hypothetical protein
MLSEALPEERTGELIIRGSAIGAIGKGNHIGIKIFVRL